MTEDDPLAYLRGEISEEKRESSSQSGPYRCIRVFVDSMAGRLNRTSRQAITCGLNLKAELGTRLEAILINGGGELPKEISLFGMDEVAVLRIQEVVSSRTLTEQLYEFLSKREHGIALFPASRLAYDIAPRLSQRFGAGLVSDVESFFLNASAGTLEMSHRTVLGRMMETVVASTGRSPFAILKENAFTEASADKKDPTPICDVGG